MSIPGSSACEHISAHCGGFPSGLEERPVAGAGRLGESWDGAEVRALVGRAPCALRGSDEGPTRFDRSGFHGTSLSQCPQWKGL